MTNRELARLIDHTLLTVDAGKRDIEKLCQEAMRFHFFSVCTNPWWVRTVQRILKDTEVKVCTVSGFPLGASTVEVKIEEARRGIDDGADEIDVVMNVGEFKDGNHTFVREEIERIAEAVGKDRTIKVIIETCVLTDSEKRLGSTIVKQAGAQFVKTSTGFASGGATVGDVRLIREAVGDSMRIKASGGIRTFEQAVALVEAGADRIGTSAGVQIMGENHAR
ncbi:MAG: deoxyribose-phosphate aldolase [bacterium]